MLAATAPLRTTKRSFESGGAELLIDDLRTATIDTGDGQKTPVRGDRVEPVQLQLVCHRLWDCLPDDVMIITRQHVLELGSVDDVLQEVYNRAVSDAAQRLKLDPQWLRTWIETHFLTRLGTRNSVYEEPSSTDGLPNAVFEILQAHQLIRSEWRARATWYELAHDRLIAAVQVSNRAVLAAERTPTRTEALGAEAAALLERAASAELTGDADVAIDAARRRATSSSSSTTRSPWPIRSTPSATPRRPSATNRVSPPWSKPPPGFANWIQPPSRPFYLMPPSPRATSAGSTKRPSSQKTLSTPPAASTTTMGWHAGTSSLDRSPKPWATSTGR